MQTVEEIYITTPRQVIEKERNARIAWTQGETKIGNIHYYPFNPEQHRWIYDKFGEGFSKTIEELYWDWYENDISCNICGQQIGLDEPMVVMEFSFCEEYKCGMNTHIDCPRIRDVYNSLNGSVKRKNNL